MSGPMNVYGYCPQCGEPGESRQRCLNGNDRCIMGHSYPSSDALKERPETNTSLGICDGLEGRIAVERDEEWSKWREAILSAPPIKFKSYWSVYIIPPDSRAITRFIVELVGVRVSVYLDCLDRLGCVGQPYYEVYPIKGVSNPDGDWPQRFLLTETEEMMAALEALLVP